MFITLLSEVTQGLNGKLESDGEFINLNYCTVKSKVKFLTFMENPKYLDQLLNNKSVSCVICNDEFNNLFNHEVYGVFVTKEPKAAFHSIHNSLFNNPEYCLPSFSTTVGENCNISPLAYISPDNVVIGNNVTIREFTTINEHTSIGDNCKIHQGTVIGGKSFSFVRQGNSEVLGLIDMGQVVLEEDVEICSNCHIARGTLPNDSTIIGKNTKLDAMVHVGHGTKIGKRVFVASGAHIAGNSVVGNDVWIGVNATVSNRLVVGDKARISLGSVVTKDVPSSETVTGNFAIEHKNFMRNLKESIFKQSQR